MILRAISASEQGRCLGCELFPQIRLPAYFVAYLCPSPCDHFTELSHRLCPSKQVRIKRHRGCFFASGKNISWRSLGSSEQIANTFSIDYIHHGMQDTKSWVCDAGTQERNGTEFNLLLIFPPSGPLVDNWLQLQDETWPRAIEREAMPCHVYVCMCLHLPSSKMP